MLGFSRKRCKSGKCFDENEYSKNAHKKRDATVIGQNLIIALATVNTISFLKRTTPENWQFWPPYSTMSITSWPGPHRPCKNASTNIKWKSHHLANWVTLKVLEVLPRFQANKSYYPTFAGLSLTTRHRVETIGSEKVGCALNEIFGMVTIAAGRN